MLKSTRSNEIAILGYGCRLPGADDPDAFWRVLSEGRCTVTEIQEDRWPKRAFGHPDPTMRGKSYVWAAGQLEDPWAFDADFFGVSPREAEQMDPQQRLILQVAWEALEHAGLPPSSLEKARTGVYVGASSSDYSNRFYLDPASIDSQFMTGNSLSLISNRLSYALDLHGPSQTVDTACSSGLYALHYAVQALRSGLIDTAIVGAVNMLLSPFPFIGFSRASMLSKTGLCRAFDAAGDGYVRSEGAAVFVLRAEHLAIAQGDRIRGYVAATGVNTDGRTPGVSQPSSERQAALLRSIYEEGGIDPNDLAFVEAHGAGTAVGDPLEAAAIGAVLGVRRDRPLPIGSVKTNIGHLEAGAGIVGLLKAQMALERGAAPRSLHFETPNPNIDFAALNLAVLAEGRALPDADADGPRLAGVNSFGFGGANGHAVLRRASVPASRRHPAPAPLIISARSEESLARLAEAYARRLADATEEEAAGLANAAAWRRERLPHRLVAPAVARAGQIAALEAFGADPASDAGASGQASATPAKTAFVFSGNGAQWAGMGREAYRGDAVFRAMFDRVSDIHARRHTDNLAAALTGPAPEAELARTSLAQPLLFAVQAALVESLADRGLRPDYVLGHSVGEVAAAWAAGIFPLEDAVRLIGVRSASQEMLRGRGLMAAVGAPAAEIEARLSEAGLAEIWVAADNSPRGATISASAAALHAFEAIAGAEKWPVKRLALDYPFHSGFADPMRDGLIADLDWLRPEEGGVGFVSTAYGRIADGHELGPAYWWKNIRSPVRFREGVERLVEAGCDVFVEIGPKPLLRGYLRDTFAACDLPLRHAPTLDVSGGDADATVARAIALGAAVEDVRVFGEPVAWPADLPLYPWRNRRFRAGDTPEGTHLLASSAASPLLGAPIRAGAHDWRRDIDAASPAYLADHVVEGAVVAPAAAMIEMAFAAGAEALAGDAEDAPPAIELKNFAIFRPIALDGGAREVRVTLSGQRAALRIETRRRLSEEDWSPAATGRLRRGWASPPSAPALEDAAPTPAAPIYEALERRGLAYGPAFRLMRDVAISGAAAEVTLAAPTEDGAGDHAIHPASLDAALHGLLAIMEDQGTTGLFLPVSIETARLFRRGAEIRSARVTVIRQSPRSVNATVLLRDAEGAVVASFEGFRFKLVPGAAPLDRDASRYATRLVPLPDPNGPAGDFGDILAWGRDSGLLADLPAEPAAAELIAEAAAQRIVLDAIAREPASEASVDRLRRLAEAAGLVARGPDGGLSETSDAPPELSSLLEALIAEEPRSAGLIGWLARLAAETPARLAPDRAERALLTRDAATEHRWNRLAAFALAALSRPNSPVGRSVLILGAPPHAAVRSLSGAGLHRLWVVDPVEGGRPGMQSDTAQWRDVAALESGPEFDLVLVGDAAGAPAPETLELAASRLAPGGAILAAERSKSLLRDLASEAPGRPRAPSGLTSLGAASFDRHALTVFHRPVGASTEAETAPTIRRLFDPTGGGFGKALRAAMAGRGVDLDLEAPIAGADAVMLAFTDAGSGAIADRMMELRPLLTAPPSERPGRLWLVTRGGAPAEGGVSVGDAAIWGFARVLANEYPDIDIRLIDLDAAAGDAGNAAHLAAHLAHPGAEREIAVRRGHSFGVRVGRAAPATRRGEQLRLVQARAGDIESLVWRPEPTRTPQDDEVEIEVAAAGLNFRDVMWAQGLLPEEALEDGLAGPTLGMECAGVVRATGPDATRFRTGDQVIAYAPACFAQRVFAREAAVAPVPEGVDAEVAAAVPTAFLTAQYALAEVARLRPGETVLIHGAAGGVGLAAIQIANAIGARVIATAGAPAKRMLARLLGAEAAFDGRAPGFADDVMAATGGGGVDVVLNSLAGDAMERGVECLKPFGRFVELGKRDFYADRELGLRPFRRNLSYFGVDADQMMKERPDLAARVLTDLSAAFARGAITPPPTTIFDAADALSAFRLMQRSGHVGKILLRPPLARPAAEAAAPIRPDAAYLVIGGVSGFGAATAEWLARRGARRLHLASRTAAPDADGAGAISRMRELGAVVTLHAADVADEPAIRAVLAEIGVAGAPLKGIVHAAMTLDDALFSAQDRGRLARVLKPKIDGVAVLDRLTREQASEPGGGLDFFCAYSSATTLVGNPGQCAYVAANAGIEALMRARRADGLPGLAVSWGAVADTGVLAREAGAGAALSARLGASRMTSADALDELGRLLGGSDPVQAFGDIDWAAARQALRLIDTPLFEQIEIGPACDAAPSCDLVDQLRGLAPEEAFAKLIAILAGEAARILRTPVSEVDPRRPLTDMGFDSLMAMDLRMALEERIGLDAPLMSLAGGATLSDLARLALGKLDAAEAGGDSVVDLVVERHVSGAGGGVTREDVEAFAARASAAESLLS